MIKDCLCDSTVWSYLVAILISLYGTCLFIWWWGKNGNPSSVFAYVTFIFVGELQESATSLIARIIRLSGNADYYLQFLSSLWWTGRKTITIMALGALVLHMTWRAFFKKFRKIRNGEPED